MEVLDIPVSLIDVSEANTRNSSVPLPRPSWRGWQTRSVAPWPASLRGRP
jgi:hypothetical protein